MNLDKNNNRIVWSDNKNLMEYPSLPNKFGDFTYRVKPYNYHKASLLNNEWEKLANKTKFPVDYFNISIEKKKEMEETYIRMTEISKELQLLL